MSDNVRQLRTGADGDLLRFYKAALPSINALVKEFAYYDKAFEGTPGMMKYLKLNLLEVQLTVTKFIDSEGKNVVRYGGDGGQRA